MKLIKQFFDFYLNSSIHVALAVVSMSWITLLDFKLECDLKILYFIFFSTITGYNFVKYFGLAKFHHRSLANWLKIIQMFSALCFLLMFYFAIQLRTTTLVILCAFGAITFLYAIPFLPKHWFVDNQKNLRSIGGLKVYVIAFVWAGVTVVLPLINNEMDLNVTVWVTFLQRYIFVIVLMLPFELRDLKYDSLKLATIPQKIGIKNTKIIGVLMGVLFFVLEIIKESTNYTNELIYGLVAAVSIAFVIFTKKNQSEYFSSFWVEGIPLFWLSLYLIF